MITTDDTINTYRANQAALLFAGIETTIQLHKLETEGQELRSAMNEAERLLMEVSAMRNRIDRILK